jgi:hypothetical protein
MRACATTPGYDAIRCRYILDLIAGLAAPEPRLPADFTKSIRLQFKKF